MYWICFPSAKVGHIDFQVKRQLEPPTVNWSPFRGACYITISKGSTS